MVKIFKQSKIPKDSSAIYSEDYVVKYRIKRGEFWTTEKITYSTASKGRLKEVTAKWRSDFANEQAELISVNYQ